MDVAGSQEFSLHLKSCDFSYEFENNPRLMAMAGGAKRAVLKPLYSAANR
jgi:hypothetical protein